MHRYGHVRYSNPLLLLGLSATAVILGAGISTLSESAVFRVLAIVPITILIIVLAASAAPAALAKSRSLAVGLRWWHWVWLLAFLSGLVFRIRDIDTIHKSALDGWAGWRIGLMALVALVLLSRLASRRTDWAAALLRGLPAGIFLCGVTSLISTLWSVYPLWTLYKSIEYLIDVALLAAVVTAVRTVEEIKSLFDWTWLLYGLLLLTVWLDVLLRPGVAVIKGIGLIGVQIQGVLVGVSANSIGDMGAMLLIIATTRLLFRSHHRSFYWLLCLAALPTLILAQSRSPFTGGLLGLLAVLLLARRFGLVALVGLAGAALNALTSAGAVVDQAFLRGQSPELFNSLSGRMGWWTFAWEVFRERPFLGFGAYAGGRFAVLGPLGVTEASSVHNAWLEILVGVGLIGLLPFLATFLGIWLNLLRPLNTGSTPSVARELRIEILGIFVLLCFRSIFTVEFIWHPPLLFFLVLAYAELLRRLRFEGVPAAQLAPAAGSRGRRIHLRGTSIGIEGPAGAPVLGP
jgi:O-antigen ligase